MSGVSSETIIPVSDPAAMMGMFIRHIKDDHGMEFDVAGDGSRFLEHDGFGLAFKPEPQGLLVRIKGPNPGVLIFFKEEIVGHVAEVDQSAANNIRWSGETSEVGSLPGNFKVLRVKSSRMIFSGMQRVTLTHEDVASMVDHGIHIRLMMPLDPTRTPVWPRMAENGIPRWPQGEDKLHARFITLRHVRLDDGEVDIDIALHEGGLISDWAEKAKDGETVGAMGPAGAARLPTSKGVFLAGDRTGLPAVARMMEIAEADATGHVVVAMPDDGDIEDYLPSSPFHVHGVPPKRFENQVVDMAREMTKPGETGFAFFAGEFQNAQDLRTHFKDTLGLDKTTQLSTAYWRRGVPGFGS
ncbi:MAG: siderophore-interacting protein [Pseudomonadota bacterium]